MGIELATPERAGLLRAVEALREWQSDAAPMQLHPGDLGWFWRFGTDATAAAVRVWSRDGSVVAVGLLDGADLLRVTMAPGALRDAELARQLAADIRDPARGVLPEGRVSVEAPTTAALQERLAEHGWGTDDPWTPLRRDLASPVDDSGVRVEVVVANRVPDRVAVQRASFDTSAFTVEAWRGLAGGPLFSDARDLVAYDSHGEAVAAITVWSAGAGRPGLIEPMGVHRDHRGVGFGRAVTLAGAAALRDLGSSSAIVCTASSNVGGIATYRAAGFVPLPEVRDRYRGA